MNHFLSLGIEQEGHFLMRAKDLILVQLKKQPMRHLCSGAEKIAKNIIQYIR